MGVLEFGLPTFVYWRLIECQAQCWECQNKTVLVPKAKDVGWRMCQQIIHQGKKEGMTIFREAGGGSQEEVTYI